MNPRRVTMIVAILITAIMSKEASAGIVFTFVESAGTVTVSYTGTLDLTGLTPVATLTLEKSYVWASSIPSIYLAPKTFYNSFQQYSNVFTSRPNFTTSNGGHEFADNNVADSGSTAIGFKGGTGNSLFINPAEWSGGQLNSGSATWTNNSFATMGLNPGSYTWTMTNSDTIVINISSSSNVPEPSTAIAMGLLGIVGFAGNRRRRRQESVA